MSNFKLSRGAQIFFIILDVVAIIYTANNRSLNDFIRYSLIIDGTILIIFFGYLFFLFREFSIVKPIYKILFPVTFYIVILGPIYYSLCVFAKDIAINIQSLSLPNYLIIPLTILTALSLGFLLFYFRLRLRFLYGISEVLVGVIIAVDKMSSENFLEIGTSKFLLAFLTASIYLIVRGFDNIHQGYTKKEPIDPFVKIIQSYFIQKKI